MSDFGEYILAIAEKKAAYNLYNYASIDLELKDIRERLAEINSQHQPIAELLENKKLNERQKLYEVAFYVVTGRFLYKENQKLKNKKA